MAFVYCSVEVKFMIVIFAFPCLLFVEGIDLVGEDAGECDAESIVKEEVDVVSKETIKSTESSLNDVDKLKRPKKKRKRYVKIIISVIIIIKVINVSCIMIIYKRRLQFSDIFDSSFPMFATLHLSSFWL